MTRVSYDPDRLDQLALRLLDISANCREMAQFCRQHAIHDLPLHDKKAREWLAKLEEWIFKARQEQRLWEIKQRGARKAREAEGS